MITPFLIWEVFFLKLSIVSRSAAQLDGINTPRIHRTGSGHLLNLPGFVLLQCLIQFLISFELLNFYKNE